MAYYAKAKGGVPFHKREEERRWKEHLEKHKQMLKKTKPTVKNNNENGNHLHVRLKLKRLQLEEDRIAKIEYENRRLLANIARIESKPNKDYWNENYIKNEKDLSPRKDDFQELEDSSESCSSESEADDEELDENEKLAKEEEKRQNRTFKQKRAEERRERIQAKREASLEHYRRVGILNELGADVTLEENKKMEKRLNQMLKKLKPANEDDVETRERIESIKEAREALKRENKVLNKNDKKKCLKEGSPREDQERIKENVRLNQKLKDIQEGKGRKKETDPQYNGLSRWWVSSPRGRQKSEYERERQKLMEEQRIAREKKKLERDEEEKKIIKKKNEEKKKEKQSVPEGYVKKRRRKNAESSTTDTDKEELPDTGIVAKDPYQINANIEDSD